MSRRMVLTKFISMHSYEEIVEIAQGQGIDVSLIQQLLPTKEILVKYLLDTGFKIGGY